MPGAGEPNFDSFENNPFANLRQRRETEVQTLLTKLAHDTIALGTCKPFLVICCCRLVLWSCPNLRLCFNSEIVLLFPFLCFSVCFFYYLDSSFVGAVEKDSAVLAAEHKSLFETANAHEKVKKVSCLFLDTLLFGL